MRSLWLILTLALTVISVSACGQNTYSISLDGQAGFFTILTVQGKTKEEQTFDANGRVLTDNKEIVIFGVCAQGIENVILMLENREAGSAICNNDRTFELRYSGLQNDSLDFVLVAETKRKELIPKSDQELKITVMSK